MKQGDILKVDKINFFAAESANPFSPIEIPATAHPFLLLAVAAAWFSSICHDSPPYDSVVGSTAAVSTAAGSVAVAQLLLQRLASAGVSSTGAGSGAWRLPCGEPFRDSGSDLNFFHLEDHEAQDLFGHF